MQTVRTHGTIEADGSLRLNIATDLPAGEADVVVVIHSTRNGNGEKYDFSKLAGKLNWRGNAIAEQRGIRDEW